MACFSEATAKVRNGFPLAAHMLAHWGACEPKHDGGPPHFPGGILFAIRNCHFTSVWECAA
jgi:hypothetical protein